MAVFFDTPDGRILAQKCALRLRKEGDNTLLTYKEPMGISGVKIMKETEVALQDAEAMRSIFQAIGLKEIGLTRKIRTEYLWKNVKIVLDQYLDTYAFIPLFMEIEAEDEDSVYMAVTALGFTPEDCKNWNTYELAAHYQAASNQ